MSTRVRSEISTGRQLSRDAGAVVVAARETRKALVRIIDTVGRRRHEVLRIDDETNIETYDVVRLSDMERKQQLYRAMTWLQTAENEMRRTRVLLERAIERAEKRVA